jgi:hypothetical protein
MPLDYSRVGLVAAAGVDPWTASEPLLAGQPDLLRDASGSFRGGAAQAAEAARLGHEADLALAGAYTNDSVAVFDAAASRGEGRVLLSEDGELMEEAARILLEIGDGLAEAQEDVRTAIQGLGLDVNETIERRNNAVAGAGPLTQAELDALDARFHQQAVDAVIRRAASVQRVVDDYDALVASRTGHLADLGYRPPASAPGPARDGGVGGFLADVGDGVGSALTGTGELLGMLNPVRAFTDGDAYWDDRVRFANSVWQLPGALAQDPLGTADQLATGGNVGTGEYGRAVGEILGGALLGGAGRILGKADDVVPPAGQHDIDGVDLDGVDPDGIQQPEPGDEIPELRAEQQTAIDYANRPERLEHTFAEKHRFEPLVERFGSREAVVEQFIRSIDGRTPESGVFALESTIGGQQVIIRGFVHDGIVKIGTAFTP